MTVERTLHDEVFDLMASHLFQVTPEMYADFDVPMQSASSLVPPPSMLGTEARAMAVIGYVGNGVRGALVLIAEASTIASWLTRLGNEDGDPADALGEFSNMLLGRLKARLLTEGIPLRLATPTIALGHRLQLSVRPGRFRSFSFDGPCGALHLRLDAQFEQDFVLEEKLSKDAPAQAGDAFLF